MFGWKNTARSAHFDLLERSGASDGTRATFANGIVAGTRVASNLGWRPVEALAPGDSVLTFDNGMQKVVKVKRATLTLTGGPADAHLMPVVVPAGVLGNSVSIRVLPDQGVVVESDAAMDAYGDPFAVIAASALDGYRGIRRGVHTQQVEVVTITFEEPQVIYADGGLLMHCPCDRVALDDMLDADGVSYDMLEGQDAAFLVECMHHESLTMSSTIAA